MFPAADASPTRAFTRKAGHSLRHASGSTDCRGPLRRTGLICMTWARAS